ncbi:Bidirectional sugar transporter sweet14 [Ranunculus cassubicifolius]
MATQNLAFVFGILGNIVSFIVFLSPLPTFYRVFKRKNTEGFQCIPYVVALFSAMLWLYYAYLKPNGSLLLIINGIGCGIESFYVVVYLIYAPNTAKIKTFKLLFLLNVVAFGAIVGFTYFLSKGKIRVTIVGWICSAFAVSVFAAPLSIIRQVLRTRSVEFMPISLSFFLTLCAVMWFWYGIFVKDLYVAIPNVLGFLFGVAQMGLYIIYRKSRPNVVPEIRLHELEPDVANEDPHTQPNDSNNTQESNECNV